VATKVKESMSDNDRRGLLQAAVTSSLAVGNTVDGPYIRDIYPDYLVYEIKNKLFQSAYVIDQKGKVVLGAAEQVIPKTVYTPYQESVSAKIDEITALAGQREDATAARETLDRMIEAVDNADLTEEEAAVLVKEADAVIVKLQEAAPTKTEDGESYPAAAFAYTPDKEKPSSWKLRLWEDPTKKVTRKQLGAAAAAFSPGGFRGQKVQLPQEAMAGTKRKIRAAYSRLGVEDGDIPRWIKEANEMRERINESCEVDISEATAEGIAKGVLPVRIIKPGFNIGKGRYYSENSINDAGTIFEGSKMYADHLAKGDRPERSVRDWVATLHETRVSESGNAVGFAHIHAGWLKEMVSNLFEAGDLGHLGTSINAVGKATKQTIDGVKTMFVEGLVKSGMQSVDFVTEAGAGGQAGLRESAIDNILDAELMDLAMLKEARPDLVRAIETDINNKVQTEVKAKMEIEDRVKELEGQLDTVTKDRDTLKEAAEQAEKDKVRAVAQATIKEAVDKAELPEAAKTKLTKVFENAETADGIADAIKDEAAYIATITETNKVKNLGNTTKDEPDAVKTKESLKEGYIKLGMSEAEAKEAAGL